MANIVVFDQAKDFYGKLSRVQKVLIVAVIVIITIILASILFFATSHSNKRLLYSSLSQKEAAKIVEKLKEKNIDYELKGDGTSIYVGANQIYDVRMDLANEGLPEDGNVGYELFDKTNLGMSEFVQKLNYKRALEGELAKTIESSRIIKSARVHLTIPEKALFLKDQKKPTSSVVLSFNSSRGENQIKVFGIQNLIASSVEGMSTDDVIIMTSRGKILSQPAVDKNSIAGLTATQYAQTKDVEAYLTNKAQTMLDGILGVGNSIVRVNANLDFTQIETTKTEYDPENQVARSEQSIVDNSQSTDSLSYPAVNMAKNQTNNITNYEIPKTIEKIVQGTGTIKRLTVSVSVNGEPAIDTVKGAPVLIHKPRNQKVMKNIELVVQKAVGYDPTRDQIAVQYFPFHNIDEDMLVQQYYEELIKDKYKDPWWKEKDNIKLFSLIIAIIAIFFLLYSLLQSKQIKERVRLALSLPDKVSLEDEEEQKEEKFEEDLEEIMLGDEDLMLVPAELPNQLLIEGDTPFEEIEPFEEEEEEEEFDKGSLAYQANASLEPGEGVDMTENAMMKLELKNKVENFVSEQPVEAVKLVRFIIAQDLLKGDFNF